MSTTSKPENSVVTRVEELSYEEAFRELDAIVTALDTEEHPLEKALSLYERGQVLAQRCASLLDQAELKVRQLSGEELIDFESQ